MATGIGQKNNFSTSTSTEKTLIYVCFVLAESCGHIEFLKNPVYQSSAQVSCNGGKKEFDQRQNGNSL